MAMMSSKFELQMLLHLILYVNNNVIERVLKTFYEFMTQKLIIIIFEGLSDSIHTI